jgi:formylglycine-generating enzyme required for sulfatase activity
VRDDEPPPPSAFVPGLPKGFDRIVLRSLAKSKEQRFATAHDLAGALRRLSAAQRRRRLAKPLLTALAIAAALFSIFLGWRHWRETNLQWAKATIAEIPNLAKEERFFEAYDRAKEAERYLPEDATLKEWRPFFTDVLSVASDPPGAAVYLRRFQRDASGQFVPREHVGVTPLQDREIARGEYLLMIEKEGYAPVLRTMSNALARVENALWIPGALRTAQLTHTPEGKYEMMVDSYAPIKIDVKLFKTDALPPRMVFVPGGDYPLMAGGRPTNEHVRLDDFFIDQFEVTNAEYQEFVDAGGYEHRTYWKHPFVKDGQSLPWEEGLALLRDATGQPGPRSWRNQQYPSGQSDHPVADVTWYEAAAYAEFRGKTLPTVFQWEKAARDGRRTVYWGAVLPWGLVSLIKPSFEDRADFYASGTVPVESLEFGASPYGCFHMAANVAEWCLNARANGFATCGGSYHEGPNMFGAIGQFPGFHSSPTLGFRCARNAPGAHGDQGAMKLEDQAAAPKFEPAPREQYQLMRAHYDYDPKPLDAKILEEVKTNAWRRLKISYVGAAGQRAKDPVPDENRALAFLWLPHYAPRPLQVVNYKPGGASYQGLTVPQETEVVCAPFLHSGRAVFVAVIQGMTDRPLPLAFQNADEATVAFRDMLVQDTVDQRRGLDYLATRDDIDMSKIVSMGLSLGGYDLVTMAVEKRFRGTILLAAGLMPGEKQKRVIAEANPINFAPYIEGPKLMIQGRYDEAIPFATEAEPLFRLLSEPKEFLVLDTGHFPPLDLWAPPALAWLDKTLGPVGETRKSPDAPATSQDR